MAIKRLKYSHLFRESDEKVGHSKREIKFNIMRDYSLRINTMYNVISELNTYN